MVDLSRNDKTVIVPIDFSQDSVKAIAMGRKHVARPEQLHVVHVVFPFDFIESRGVMDEEMLISEELRAEVDAQMTDSIRQADAVGASSIILVGDPGLAIADYAADIRADLIVVPTHGYHGVKRLFLGSTTERIIRHANCSVLVIRRSDAD